MKKIAIIGSINMDMTASADKIPLKGETVSARSVAYVPGGKGDNQAVAAARLGGDVTMFGCVGDDAFGERLIENLKMNGVQTEYMEVLPGVSSGIAMIVVAENDNVITVIPGANQYVSVEYIERHRKEILEADIFLLQNEIPAKSLKYAVNLLSEAGKTIIYNPAPAAPADPDFIEKITYFTPNEHEARIVLNDQETPLEDLLKKYDGRLIITLGSQGITSAKDGKQIFVPARKSEVVDTTGAGDTMNGAFAYALSVDMEFEESLSFANTAAGLSIKKPGAQAGMPTYKEVAAERLS